MMASSNKNYMMKLGEFEFAVKAASFNKLSYASSYRWEPNEAPTKTNSPLMQYIGPGERTLDIEGIIYPQMAANGLKQVDDMRKQASRGEPLQLCYVEAAAGGIGGVGRILGKWCISSINEERTLFLADGNPREITFSMSLKAYKFKVE
ncbi:phage tail protein [Thalassomonas haliotis]|uniref:Phage tail protein n=2 Tax=Thalassomonas haliotis TaxID=485448 RepID=A0ABY7VNH8_9GAMM|nr:phage tail protein [Thalassomonas haliotis]